MRSFLSFLLSYLIAFQPLFAAQKFGSDIDLQGNKLQNAELDKLAVPDFLEFATSEEPTAPATEGSLKLFTNDGKLMSINKDGTVVEYGNGEGNIVGPETSTNNGIATYDDATGKLLKSNTATLIDGDMSGLTQLNVDNLRLDGNALSVTNSNGSLALAPNGTGSITASTTGNARGDNALDLQIYRNGVSEVASGGYSVLMGSASTASGFGSVVAGSFNTASHSYATVLGNGGASDNNGDFIVGGKVSPVSSSKSQVHFEVDGPTSNASIGRQTDQSSVAGAENTLKLHTTNASNQSKFIGIKAPSTLTTSTTYTMPTADGVDGSFLSTNGSGALAWKAANGGSGEVNAVTNPNATNNINGYADSDGGSDVSRDTTAANLALYPTIETGVKVNADAATEYISYCGAMPAGLKNRKLKLEWFQVPESGYASGDQKLEVYSTTSSTCASSLTRLALSTDASSVTAIPNATGKFTTTADTNSDGYFQIRWVRVSGTKFLTLQNIIYGPGIQPQGYAGGEYEETSSFTIAGASSNPTPGTNVMYRRTTRDGEYAIIRWEYYQSGAGSAGSGDYLLPIPAGLTINYSKIGKVLPGSNPVGVSGYAKLYNGTHFLGAPLVSSSGSYANKVFVNVSNDVTAPTTWGSSFAPLSGSTVQVSVEARVPISEWAGSGTLNVAQNDVEYVWNSSSTDAADTTSFGYGPQGTAGVMTVTNLTANRAKRVRFQSPIQATDQIWVEVFDSVSGTWMPISANRNGTLSYMEQNGTAYGIYLAGVNSTDIDVNFARYAIATGAFSAAGANWSGIAAGSKWRVVKAKAGSAVGFGAATATQSGLVSAEESGSFTANFTGARTTSSVIKYYRVGKQVTLFIPNNNNVNATANDYFVALASIPASIRPPSNNYYTLLSQDNAVTAIGQLTLESSGNLKIYSSPIGTGLFTNGALCGWYATHITYLIN